MTPVLAQFAPDELAALDALVRDGVAESRSDAIRMAVAQLYDRHQRASVGLGIREAYQSQPQTEADDALALANAMALTNAEPW